MSSERTLDASGREAVEQACRELGINVLLKPGFITILNIDLNHKGEVISYDVQYVDWSPSHATKQMELEKGTETFDMSDEQANFVIALEQHTHSTLGAALYEINDFLDSRGL